MRYRKLSRNGPNVSAIGLGCMSLGIADIYTSSVRSDDDAIALIDHALKLGITLLDTADIYGEPSVAILRRAQRVHPIAAVQIGECGF